jgi:hypothetical protein
MFCAIDKTRFFVAPLGDSSTFGCIKWRHNEMNGRSKIRLLSVLLLATVALPVTAETFRLRAPTEALEAVIHADKTLTLEVRFRGRIAVSTPPLGLDVDGHLVEGPLAAIS